VRHTVVDEFIQDKLYDYYPTLRKRIQLKRIKQKIHRLLQRHEPSQLS
jgi:hypothetical protein